MNKSIYPRSLGIYDYRSYIANERHARSLLVSIRWPNGAKCIRCNSSAIWSMQEDYRCKDCSHHFSVTSSTIFNRSHLKVSQWILAIGLFKIGVNGLGLQWSLGCHYRTARRVLRVLRSATAKDPLIQQLQGEIEADEAYYGGRQKGKRGRGAKHKMAVLGFKERGGYTKTLVVPNVTEETITQVTKDNIAPGSTVYTDGFRSYNDLKEQGFKHIPHDHTVRFIKDDVTHTQGIEGYWGHTKPISKARYRRITPKSLPGICAENDYRTNNRQNPDFIELMLNQLLKFYP
jgi:transposase